MDLYDFLRKLILPIKTIDYYLPKGGLIVDLGCGQGVIAKYLARNSKREVIGVDIDVQRLPVSDSKNLKFKNQNILKYNLVNANGVVLSDVLHHLKLKDQENLLGKISKGLKKDGVLIIKEIDTREFIRSKLSRIWDLILYPQDNIHFRNLENLKNKLENLGFKVIFLRASRIFPGSTNLLICQK